MTEHDVLEDALRQSRLVECLGEALADEQRLRRMLQDHAVARHQCRNDGVDRREIGIVPRRDDHDDAERHVFDVAAEARPVVFDDWSQRRFGNLDHVARAFFHAALFAAIAYRTAHLPGDLRHNLVIHGEQCIKRRQA